MPFDKSLVTLALESGVDAVIVPEHDVELVRGLARGTVVPEESLRIMPVAAKEDECAILEAMRKGEKVALQAGWEVIPVENLLAQSDEVLAEVTDLDNARLACGILERGVAGIVVPRELAGDLKSIVAQCKIAQKPEHLLRAKITRVQPVGLAHRVCLDTMTLMHKGQGMLVGNSSAFTFLVHAETEHNEYVASRPFRVNAGAVHAYIRLPHDRTTYLGELKAGDELLVTDASGDTSVAILGRVKIEVRPMLLIEAEAEAGNGNIKKGAIFLQNAETIRLTRPDGEPVSVVTLQPGDEVLCRLDEAGRHFGMRVKEAILEV